MTRNTLQAVGTSAGAPKGWGRFARALARTLRSLREEQYLVLADRGGNRFVQFAGGGDEGFRLEATSNRFLEGSQRLDASQRGRLQAAGWKAPTTRARKGSPPSPNYHVDFGVPVKYDAVVGLTLETLTGIFGIRKPGDLEYRAFDANAGTLRFDELGIPPEAEAEEPNLREQFAPQLKQAMRKITRLPELEPDQDGDYAMGYGDIAFIVMPRGEPPIVKLLSPLVSDIEASDKVYRALNELNQNSNRVRFFFREGQIFATAEVLGVPFVADHLDQTMKEFFEVAEHMSIMLEAQFGSERSADFTPGPNTLQ